MLGSTVACNQFFDHSKNYVATEVWYLKVNKKKTSTWMTSNEAKPMSMNIYISLGVRLTFRVPWMVLESVHPEFAAFNKEYGCSRTDAVVLPLIRLQQEGSFSWRLYLKARRPKIVCSVVFFISCIVSNDQCNKPKIYKFYHSIHWESNRVTI